jgi:hypothetical protein
MWYCLKELEEMSKNVPIEEVGDSAQSVLERDSS